MDFALSEEDQMIRDTVEAIAASEIAPLAPLLDHSFGKEGREAFLANLKMLAETGLMGLNVPAEYGGSEAGPIAYAVTMEALGAACAATALTVSVTNMVAEVISRTGNEETKQRFLPPICDGSWPAASFCLTEEGAGSDPGSLRMKARRDGDDYILDGTKIYISSADYAGCYVVWAKSDPQARTGKGITCFAVAADTPGISLGRLEEKMGQHGSATREVVFEGVRVPVSQILGGEHDGFRVAVGELTGGRIGIGSMALGIGRAALSAAKEHALNRKQFGNRLADMQGIQWMLADAETEMEAARLLILRAAWAKAQGLPFVKEASMAKLYASEFAQRATYTALQIHGGAGYIRDYPLERYARDARITTIYEGTSEIQRLIIAREVLLRQAA